MKDGPGGRGGEANYDRVALRGDGNVRGKIGGAGRRGGGREGWGQGKQGDTTVMHDMKECLGECEVTT